MIAGRKTFEGKSQVNLIDAILEREPAAISTIMRTSPAALDRLIHRRRMAEGCFLRDVA